ncbi:hypothetical protein FGB62_42g26 [Gracilaria domingensis]|nr:hypothetical protein FGB62_42g26 [Gracilaria domingensis]
MRQAERYPGMSIVIMGHGARVPVPFPSSHIARAAGRLFCHSTPRRNCLWAAFAIVVHRMEGRSAADAVVRSLRDSDIPLRNVGSASRALEAALCCLALPKLPSRRRSFSAVVGLRESRSSVFLVARLRTGSGVDHIVGVDARYGLILDGTEAFPLHLSHEALSICGSGDPVVTEIREIYRVGCR